MSLSEFWYRQSAASKIGIGIMAAVLAYVAYSALTHKPQQQGMYGVNVPPTTTIPYGVVRVVQIPQEINSSNVIS